MSTPAVLCGTCLGDLEWDPESELWFADGIPGFENEKRIVPVEIPTQRPLVYLQSAQTPALCFLALPASTIQPGFEVRLSAEDLLALELDPECEPVPGKDILCLALLGPAKSGIRANLAAPVVISLHSMRGHQLTPSGGPRYWSLGDHGAWEGSCS